MRCEPMFGVAVAGGEVSVHGLDHTAPTEIGGREVVRCTVHHVLQRACDSHVKNISNRTSGLPFETTTRPLGDRNGIRRSMRPCRCQGAWLCPRSAVLAALQQ